MIKDVEEGKYEYVTYPWRNDLDAYLNDTFGLTFRDLCGYDAAFNMQLINTRFYAELERRINEERLRRGIPLEARIGAGVRDIFTGGHFFWKRPLFLSKESTGIFDATK